MRIIGGLKVDPDDRIRGTFHHNPSSLRLSMSDPSLHQIPRGSDEISRFVKDIFVAPEGHVFWERDYSGIEAKLVGVFAGSKTYTELAALDVHSFYTAYAINTLDPSRMLANDLPSINWDRNRLAIRLKEIKKEFGKERNELYKHLVHGANFKQSPRGARDKIFKDTGRAYDLSLVSRVMGVYFELFPEIPTWHHDLCHRIDGTKSRCADSDGVDLLNPWSFGVAYVRNPFGYTHHYYSVLDWQKVGEDWISTYGEDACRAISFLPQSTAAAIIKKSAKRLFYERPATGNTLRLLIHDSMLGEAKEEEVERCLEESREIMESPIEEIPLDPTWEMGEYLTIGSEAKVGRSWGAMK